MCHEEKNYPKSLILVICPIKLSKFRFSVKESLLDIMENLPKWIDCQTLTFENSENCINLCRLLDIGAIREVKDVSKQRFSESRIFSSDWISCVMNTSS